MDTIIRNGTIVTASDIYQADVGIAGGKIVAIGRDLGEADRVIDATGKQVMPGGIDIHTHLDHFVPYIGTTNADDFYTGTVAAAMGGITTIGDFAFQHGDESLPSVIEQWQAKAKGKAIIDYGFHVTITNPSPERVAEIADVVSAGFTSIKLFLTVSGFAVADRWVARIMRECRRQNALVQVHAEDGNIIDVLTEDLLAEGKTDVRHISASRPELAEGLATAKIAAYSEILETPTYFVHLSCRPALDAVRTARARGAPVYAETRPVYLHLDQSRYELPDREGQKYVCLPPLRAAANQEALWNGLRNDDLQIVATDHAPWLCDQKLAGKTFATTPAGVSNLETIFPMLYSRGVMEGRLSLNRFVEVMCTNPAKLFGMYPKKGTIAVGSDADVVIVDPEKRVTIRAKEMHSRADYDPYEGFVVQGWPVLTMSRGEVICANGKLLAAPGRGELIKRSKFTGL